MWTDYQPNGDFTEAILNSSFDWHGKRQPTVFATENDNLNGLSMLFGNLLTGKASGILGCALLLESRRRWNA